MEHSIDNGDSRTVNAVNFVKLVIYCREGLLKVYFHQKHTYTYI
uniref:Uncharacterized protein n=1 Tax=Octopus bimaculoides TaxID=37653 RepID=A0A0L8HEC5_OCTBM